MKNLKKLFALLLILAIITSLFACSPNSNQNSVELLDTPVADGKSVIAAQNEPDEGHRERIKTIVEDFLRDCAFSIYYHEPRDIQANTIKQLSKRELMAIPADEYFTQTRASMESNLLDMPTTSKQDIDTLTRNIKLQENRIAYFAHLYQTQNISFTYFSPSYSVAEIIVNNNTAIVQVFESLDYQYSNYDSPSFELVEYNIGLILFEGKWLIAEICSDDIFYQIFHETGFNLEKEIQYYDTKMERASRNSEDSLGLSIEDNSNSIIRAISGNNYTYNKQNAVNYALTYSTIDNDGKAIPTYRNTDFLWNNASCMLFASQCVWAGFGGSNSLTDINNKYGMDTSGSYLWWSTSSGNPSASWWNCGEFIKYIGGSNGNLDEIGVTATRYFLPYGSTTLTTGYINDRPNGTGSFTGNTQTVSYSALIGAVILVKGSAGRMEHAIFVTDATSGSTSGIYFTAYNNCYKNKLLSTNYNGSSVDYDYCVIIPTQFRSGSSNNRLWADLQNAIVCGKTLTLKSYASATVGSLSTRIYPPGATSPSITYTVSNTSSWSSNYTFGTVGTWKIEILSTNPSISMFTYIIRVV